MKQRRHFIQQTPDGKILFAPLPEWWDIHYAASKRRFGDPAYKHFSNRRLVRELNAELKAAGKNAVPWLLVFSAHPLKKFSWFLPWLLRGKKVPDSVTIVQPAVLAWAARAWDYVAICRAAGVSISAYDKSLRTIPGAHGLDLLKWYFDAGPAPAGCVLLDEQLQKLRSERSIRRICSPSAARVSGTTWKQWQKDPELKDLVGRAVEAATNSGYSSALQDLPAWKSAGPRTRESIWNFAKAATIAACSRRAKIDPTIYSAKKRQAKDLKASAPFEKYLAIEDRGKSHRKADLVDPKLLAPRPFALRFHAAAAARHPERPRDLLELTKHPLFDQWFLDSVIPRKMAGRARPLFDLAPSENGEAPARPSKGLPSRKLTAKRAKHLIWRAWQKAGRTLGQISLAWGELPGEKPPARAAIATELRRLKDQEDSRGKLRNEEQETKIAFGMFRLTLRR